MAISAANLILQSVASAKRRYAYKTSIVGVHHITP